MSSIQQKFLQYYNKVDNVLQQYKKISTSIVDNPVSNILDNRSFSVKSSQKLILKLIQQTASNP